MNPSRICLIFFLFEIFEDWLVTKLMEISESYNSTIKKREIPNLWSK